MTTDKLVRAACDGDQNAFTMLHQSHARFVHALLLAYADPDDVPDLLQEVFFSAWQKLATLRDPSAFSGWLSAITRNVGLMHVRGRRMHVPLTGDIQSTEIPPDTVLDAEKALELIRMLPDNLREPILLRLVEGMDGAQIAAHLGMSHSTVRVNLHRGMKRVRELMESPDV